MYRLTVSNGLEINASNHKTYEEAHEAMRQFYETLGAVAEEKYAEDASYFGEIGAFHVARNDQGEEECNIFDISEIPADVSGMSADEILELVSDEVKWEMYEALKKELEEEREM